jgi:hypothetical protein
MDGMETSLAKTFGGGGDGDPPRQNFGEFVRLLVVPAGYMVKLDVVEPVFEGLYSTAVRLHLVVMTTRILHDLVDNELRVPLASRRLMPVSMAILSPQRRASYSAMLFDAGKCRHTAYHMCSPRGEMKSKPAPAPVFITNLSK